MNLEELQAVRETERSKTSLQTLRDSFYQDAAAFIQDLREQREQAAKETNDPFDDPTVNRLSDEIASAEQTVESIYDRRIGKLVKQASFAAASMPAEDAGLTAEEQELYRVLVEEIAQNRASILSIIAGDHSVIRDDSDTPEPDTQNGTESPSTADEPRKRPPADDVPRTTVRITEDIGEIVGVDDRTYDLRPDDIVTLPDRNAKPLLERDVAVNVE